MAFKTAYQDQCKIELDRIIIKKINLYGIWTPIVLALQFTNDAIAFLRSLNEKHNLVQRFGLDRIW